MNKRTVLFNLLVVVALVLGSAPITALAQPAPAVSEPAAAYEPPSPKIEQMLLDKFATEGQSDFIVRFVEQADLSPAYKMDWNARGEFVYNTLKATAERTQAQAIKYVEAQGLRHQTFIAGNELYVWAGDLNTVNALAALPEVESIQAPRTYYLHPFPIAPSVAGPTTEMLQAPQATVDWGITDTKADQFWAQFGVKGNGIVVANIDTGVQWNHPALVNQFKCPGDPTNPACWSDPSNICGAGGACDNNGHGTHTMGTMVAKDDPALPYIAGMAPNAQWIACKGCESSSCSRTALSACADWILAPGGNSANRPHIVNNSWGGGGGDTWYLSKVNAWRAAGIFPAFSAGNSGPTCGTIGSPSDYQESFASAAHSSNRVIASFSSRGASAFGHDPYTKPNISAPGDYICSTVPTNGWDCSYSGTSMASPHTAGAVALLWSCNASLRGQITDTFELLQNTADTPPAGNCGAPPDGEGNYTYGYGYLNVLAAGQQVCFSDFGVISGTVYNALTNGPIAGADVAAIRDGGGLWSDATDATGFYSMTVGAGTFTMTVQHPHYTGVVVTNVVVPSDTTVVQDFYLQPRGRLWGYVTDYDNGTPLDAVVTADNGVSVNTDPATGLYEMWLDQGTYTVTAEATDYASQTVTVNILAGQDTQQDFALLAAIAVVPDPIEATVELGQAVSVTAVMTNNMAVPYSFEFIEMPSAQAAIMGSGGPDPFGYTFKDSNEPDGARFEWIDATDGTALGLADDGEATVVLPFPFTFYGETSTNLCIGNNGGALFNPATCDLTLANADLGTTTVNKLIVPFWDDIDSDTGDVYYKTVGTAPHRIFVVEWYNRPHYNNIGNATFELLLFEGTNNIKFQYLDTNFGNALYDYGVSATSGIRQQTPNYLQYSYNQPVLVDDLAICFQYPGSPPCDGGDIPWYGTDITAGTVPAGSSLGWTNYFTATPDKGIDQPGQYHAHLFIQPAAGGPAKQIPLIMNVLPTADMGLLEGTVTSDRPGGPLEADLFIESSGGLTWTLTSDPATGYYSYWFEQGSYTVTASAAGYVSQTVNVQITGLATTTQDFELALNAPEIVIDPLALAQTLVFGESATQTLTIANDGLQPLGWQLFEIPGSGPGLMRTGGPDPFGYTFKDSNEPGGARFEWIDATDGTALGLADDGEATVVLPFPFTFYGETSTNLCIGNNGGALFNPATCDLTLSNADLGTTTVNKLIVPFWDDIDSDTGDVYYKTVGTAPHRIFVVEWYNRPHFSNTGNATFELLLFEGTNNIKFQYLDTNFGNASYDYGVSATSGIRQQTPNYLQYSYNQPVLVDGLAICFQYPGSPPCDVWDVPWLAEQPISGTLNVAESITVEVTFDSGVVPEPGVYTAWLLAFSNDPLASSVMVPVTLSVEPSADLGKVEGIITSMGYCDGENDPLEATVVIENSAGVTWTVTSNPATGYYYRWLNADTYTVTATAPEHLSAMGVVTVTGQATTTLDLALRYIESCMDVTPTSFSLTLPVDTVFTDALSIINNGAGDLTWQLAEVGQTLQLQRREGTSAPAGQYDPALVAEIVGAPVAALPAPAGAAPTFEYPNAMLYNNGPLVTHPGGGYNGGDASALQTALGMDTYGFGNQFANGYRMADDFTITDPVGWQIDSITFFAYQTNAPATPSPITGVYYQIWDGPPNNPNSHVVFGDLTTNRLQSSTFANIYRVLDTGLLDTARRVFANKATAGVALPAGTYWLDWTTAGSSSYTGPWAPPITILGQTTTGNALQYTGAWAPVQDGGTLTPQGMPFIIEGNVLFSDVPWVSEVPTNGLVTADSGFVVDVVFDTTGLTVGECYTASLVLVHDDPGWTSPFYIPLELCVTEQVVPPVASFESNSPVCLGQPMVFTDTSTNFPTQWQWTFGDGHTSTLQNPSHVYTATGRYTVTLQVCNSAGCDDTEGVVEVKPLPEAGFEYAVDGLTVVFTNTSANAASFLWEFGDGTTSTTTNPVYAYAVEGTYVVTLTATGDCGQDVFTDTVTVVACEPVNITDVATSSPVLLSQAMLFTPTVTGDGPFSFLWEFGDGVTSTLETPSHVYELTGQYVVTLTVENECPSSDVYTLTVEVECPPVTDADFEWAPITPTVGQAVAFTGTAQSLVAVGYDWNLGDGHLGSGITPTHVYTAAGTYDVVMMATNACGAYAVVSHTLTVEPLPTYLLTVVITPTGSGAVTLDPSGGVYPVGTVVTLTAVPNTGWTFVGWSGDVTGTTNPITVTMTADKTVTATFRRVYRLYLPVVMKNH